MQCFTVDLGQHSEPRRVPRRVRQRLEPKMEPCTDVLLGTEPSRKWARLIAWTRQRGHRDEIIQQKIGQARNNRIEILSQRRQNAAAHYDRAKKIAREAREKKILASQAKSAEIVEALQLAEKRRERLRHDQVQSRQKHHAHARRVSVERERRSSSESAETWQSWLSPSPPRSRSTRYYSILQECCAHV